MSEGNKENKINPPDGNETSPSKKSFQEMFDMMLNIMTVALFLFLVPSCSYYSIMAVMYHNPSVTYDAQAIKACWVIFFMVALATTVMRESFIENLVKSALFLIIFILLILFQSSYALHAFAALLGSFVGSIFTPRST